jgi:hypothetical protein
MDGHDSLTLTFLSLRYLFVNVLYVRTLFLLLHTFCQAWPRLVMHSHELLYILGFELYTVCMTLDEAT